MNINIPCRSTQRPLSLVGASPFGVAVSLVSASPFGVTVSLVGASLFGVAVSLVGASLFGVAVSLVGASLLFCRCLFCPDGRPYTGHNVCPV